MLGRTNDTDGDGMSDAYEHLVSHTDPNHPDAPIILVQPFGQTVDQGDTVAFSVVAEGAPSLGYQWFLGSNPVSGETNSALTILSADPSQQGDYSVQVTSPVGLSVLSSNATLMVNSPYYWPLITLTGQRYNYTFKNGVTYYVGSRVELYGVTTIEGGAIIKADWYSTNSTLAIMGTLVCKTDDAYFPAFFTSVDDDTLGDAFYYSSSYPATANNGAPYLDLTSCQDPQPSLSNLRIRYADQGVTLPASTHVDLWDCQFLQCNAAVIADQGSTAAFHNGLFAACGAVASGVTNFPAITAEHITADVTNFWGLYAPSQIALTNSIVLGSIGTGPTLVTDHTAINPVSPFQTVGSGNYYLQSGSPYRAAGTPAISPRLAAEFKQRSTQAPTPFSDFAQVTGDMALGPQAARYTNGAPDYGFYYPALDYTVAFMVNFGNITVLPGTAIGFRNEPSAQGPWTWWGFDLREGSKFISHGTPTKPNVFADVQLVQEQLASPCIASFVPDFWPDGQNDAAPSLDFRFSSFYANSAWFHFWSGLDAYYGYLYSPDSLMNWTMQDCSLHGGRITIGEPDDGSWYGFPYDGVYGECAVLWKNNLFNNVAIDLDPTLYEYGADDQGLNVDMAFQAYNNLFRGGLWFHLEPIPASAGDWLWKDNLFDKVDFVQDTSEPVNNNYNGYWPLSTFELSWLYNYYPWYQANSGQFLASTNSGGNEQVLTAAPPYQSGPLGDYYLPTTTPLYHAGSRTPSDAGLFHYTTRVDQIKEGEEFSGHMVNIGLHYIAATNGVPKDSDADGIPDYVENASGTGTVGANETDWQNAYTIPGVYDPTNAVYDDIDLSGNGLVGRVKKALGISPFATGNPLVLRQTLTGDEPDIVTFEVPFSYDALASIGVVSLNANGNDATLQECQRATNGNCLLLWNTTYDQPGQNYLQAKLILKPTGDERSVLSGLGSSLPFTSSNVVQFSEWNSQFDENGGVLYAQLPEPDANYTIELKTTSGDHIKTITGSTSSGVIQENWDLTYDDGVTTFTGDSVDAVFSVTLLDPASGTHTQRLNRAPGYRPNDGYFDVAYAYNCNPTFLQEDGEFWNQMTGVLDTLLAPRNGYDEVYDSTFDWYWDWGDPGYPGYMPNRAKALDLLTNLAQADTRNFYFYGHGGPDYIGNGSDGPDDAFLRAGEVSAALTNNVSVKGGIVAMHPYRFVFLDACSTAETKEWQHAFGLLYPGGGRMWNDTRPPRAFMGWASEKVGLGATTATTTTCTDYGTTVNVFFDCWMSGFSLDYCIRVASVNYSSANYTVKNPSGLHLPLPVPGTEHCILSDGTQFDRTGGCPPLKVVGYRGLTRTGYDPSY